MFKAKMPSKVTRSGGRQDSLRSPSQHSFLPAGLIITGDLVSAGDIHIEGSVQGDITCRVLTLTGEPHIEGTVNAESVHVAGTFHGTLNARKVTLTRAARMAGEIYYETLEMAPGAQFEGKLGQFKPQE